MRKIIKCNVFILALLAVNFFDASFALAASEPEGALNNIFVTEIEANYSESESNVQGSFEIINASSSQTFSDLGYKLYLMSEEDYQSFRFLDDTGSLGIFSIKPGEKIKKDYSYNLPAGIPSGGYVLRYQIIDNGGRRVGYNDFNFTINETSAGKQLDIDQGSVKLVVNDAEEHGWNEGPTVKTSDKVSVKFELKNKSDSSLSDLPVSLKVYEYNSNGKLIEEKKLGSVDIGASEKKLLIYEMSKYDKAASYFSVISIEKSGVFTPPAQARWVVEGVQGKLLSVSGENGMLNLEIVGSPFLQDIEGKVKFVYKNKNGQECGFVEEDVSTIGENTGTVSSKVLGGSGCVPAFVEAELLIDGKSIDKKSFELDRIESYKTSTDLVGLTKDSVFNSTIPIILVILLVVAIVAAMVFYIKRFKKSNKHITHLVLAIVFISSACVAFSLKDKIRKQGGLFSDDLKVLGQQSATVGNYGKFVYYASLKSAHAHYYSAACTAINTYENSSPDDNMDLVYNVEPYVKSCTCKNNGATKIFDGEGLPADAALDICYYDICKYQSRSNHGPFKQVWFAGIPNYTAGFYFEVHCSTNYACEAELNKCICSSDKSIAISDSPYGPFGYDLYQRKIVDNNYNEQQIRDYCTQKCEYNNSNYCEAKECECADGYKFPVPAGKYTATCTEDHKVVGDDAQQAVNYCLSQNICKQPWMPKPFNSIPDDYFSGIEYIAHSMDDDLDQQRQCLSDKEKFCFLSGVKGCDNNPHRTYSHSQINWASPVPEAEYNVGENVIAKTMNAKVWCDNSTNFSGGIRFKVYDDSTGEMVANVADDSAWDKHPINYTADLGTFEPGRYTIYMEARAESYILYQGMLRHFSVVDPNAESVTINLMDTAGNPVNYTGPVNVRIGGTDTYTLNFSGTSSETLVKDIVCPGGATPCVGQPGVELTAPTIANHMVETISYNPANPAVPNTGVLSNGESCVVDVTYENNNLTVDLKASKDNGSSWVSNISSSVALQDIDLQANVTSGFVIGQPATYQFFCNQNDSTPAKTLNNQVDSIVQAKDVCDYTSTGNYVPKVIVTQGTKTGQGTANVNVNIPCTPDFFCANLSTCPSSECGNTNYYYGPCMNSCTGTPVDDFNCDASCRTSCPACKPSGMIEVNP